MSLNTTDTIAAIATPPGRSGVGIIRVSGPQTKTIAKSILGKLPITRCASFFCFKDEDGSSLDEGLAIYFEGPNSFTGEDVLELHGHGSPIVLDCLLKRVLLLGARIAQPGEFSFRSFMNNKMDLMKAESVADLINAHSEQAARSAIRSMQGEFSKKIHVLLQALIDLRVLVEASIDFPEEEIDFLTEEKINPPLITMISKIKAIQSVAKQGVLLQEGIRVVIVGEPNVGKSSLLNCLSGRDSAIVTEIAGTTRDALKEQIHLDGLPVHVVDTAGLRKTNDSIEREGILRAHHEMKQADMLLVVADGMMKQESEQIFQTLNLDEILVEKTPMTIVVNKIDLMRRQPEKIKHRNHDTIFLSAKTGQGIDILKNHLKEHMGYQKSEEGNFIARRRHLDALSRALTHLEKGQSEYETNRAGELLAENLKLSQQALSEITGDFSADDLLGEIFSTFCIGK